MILEKIMMRCQRRISSETMMIVFKTNAERIECTQQSFSKMRFCPEYFHQSRIILKKLVR